MCWCWFSVTGVRIAAVTTWWRCRPMGSMWFSGRTGLIPLSQTWSSTTLRWASSPSWSCSRCPVVRWVFFSSFKGFHNCLVWYKEGVWFVCLQRCDQEPDYEELKAFISSVESSAVCPAEEAHQDMDTDSNKVHLQMQRLFLPPGGKTNVESHKPPVLKRISDRRRRVDAAQMEHKDDDSTHESRPFPRLYPSIRLAMREIQQIQQVQRHRRYIDRG